MKAERVLLDNPLIEQDRILGEHFYAPREVPPALGIIDAEPKPPPPEHYKVICISIYKDDLAHVDALVQELKRRGHTKASRSQLIRFALAHVNIDALPKGY